MSDERKTYHTKMVRACDLRAGDSVKAGITWYVVESVTPTGSHVTVSVVDGPPLSCRSTNLVEIQVEDDD
jgi:hypothetical protein